MNTLDPLPGQSSLFEEIFTSMGGTVVDCTPKFSGYHAACSCNQPFGGQKPLCPIHDPLPETTTTTATTANTFRELRLAPPSSPAPILAGPLPPEMTKATVPFSVSVSRLNPNIDSKKEAIERVRRNADPLWMSEALAVVQEICRQAPEFTTDDVWSVLDGLDVSTSQRKALGPVMTKGTENGWCKEKDCRPVPSRRPVCHGRRIPVYQSLLYPSSNA